MTDPTPHGDFEQATPLHRAIARVSEVRQRVRTMDPLRRKVLLGSLAAGAAVITGLAVYLGVQVHPSTVILLIAALVLPRLILDRVMCRLIERHEAREQRAQKAAGVFSRIRSLWR